MVEEAEALVVPVEPNVVGAIDGQSKWLHFATGGEDSDQRARGILDDRITFVVAGTQIAIGIEGDPIGPFSESVIVFLVSCL